jgi:hypothetical protein
MDDESQRNIENKYMDGHDLSSPLVKKEHFQKVFVAIAPQPRQSECVATSTSLH